MKLSFDSDLKTIDQYVSMNGSNVIVKKGSVLKQPLTFELTDQLSLDVTVEQSCELTMIIDLRDAITNGVTYDLTLDIAPNSHVSYVLLSETSQQDITINQTIDLAKDAKVHVISAFLSESLQANLKVRLNGQGSNVMMNAIAVSSNKQSQVIDVNMTHYAPYSYADMYNIGIANGEGRIVLNGVEKIEQGMTQANAFQTLKGIILSDKAIVEVNPILLIDEYDVKAGHGATIGKIEENQLYYLQSRGLTKDEAEKLIINGYIKPILDEIKDETISKRLEASIYQRL
jgi:Fe-S cluster assembly protein SufD